MHFFRDCGVSSVLVRQSDRILMYSMYTAVLRAVLSCIHKKITIFRGALKTLWLIEVQIIDSDRG
jgi:hypothetical protein